MAPRLIVLLVCLGLLPACSITPARSALVPETYQVGARHDGVVRVFVTGGEESNMWEGIGISNETFAGALEDAIVKSALFPRVGQLADASYLIEVVMQRLSRPVAGFTFESQFGALWVLKALSPDRVIWQDLVVTTGSASMGDAVVGVTRARMAIERAAKNNIQRAIDEMGLLKLKAAEPKPSPQ